jgi:hypothetical protein
MIRRLPISAHIYTLLAGKCKTMRKKLRNKEKLKINRKIDR